MKFFAFVAAGLIAAGALTPTPAAAQRYGGGYYDRGWDRGWHDGRGWDRDRDYRWERRRYWDRGRRWNRGRWGWRGRVRCGWIDTWDGPVRRCWRR